MKINDRVIIVVCLKKTKPLQHHVGAASFYIEEIKKSSIRRKTPEDVFQYLLDAGVKETLQKICFFFEWRKFVGVLSILDSDFVLGDC